MTNVVSITEVLNGAEEQKRLWPEPTPLPYALPSVPAFNPNLLPTQLGPWLEDITERLNVPMDFLGIPAMIAAGSLIGANIAVRPQANTTWWEPANVWGCIVGSPGVMKSPAVSEVLAPIRRLDSRAEKAFENELAFFDDEMVVHKLARDAAEKQARASVKEGDMIGAQEIIAGVREPSPPSATRYLLTDATVEKLGEICAHNPNGILFYRDELLTMLSELESEEKAAARGFFMTGWSGKDFYSFDRITRGTIRIPRVNLSLLGTTQPTRLAKYIRGSLSDKNDGMVQRLQLLTWPDLTKDWSDVDRHPNSAAREAAFACFENLSMLNADAVGAMRDASDDGSGVPYLRFSPGAIELFLTYRAWLEPTLRGDELPSALVAHLSKYRGLIARLALIYHLASGGIGPVTEQAVAIALEWAKYLEAHARRAYGSLMVDNGDAARTIWKKIQKGDLRDGFTERDIYNRNWANLQKGPRLTDGLKLLVENDWLSSHVRQTAGRSSTVFNINPKALCNPALAA